MGVSFDHTLCDGRGAAQFLKGVAEIARGEAGLSIEAVWQRDFLKPQQHSHLIRFQHDELLESGFVANPNCSIPNVNAEELTLASFLLNSDALQSMQVVCSLEIRNFQLFTCNNLHVNIYRNKCKFQLLISFVNM